MRRLGASVAPAYTHGVASYRREDGVAGDDLWEETDESVSTPTRLVGVAAACVAGASLMGLASTTPPHVAGYVLSVLVGFLISRHFHADLELRRQSNYRRNPTVNLVAKALAVLAILTMIWNASQLAFRLATA